MLFPLLHYLVTPPLVFIARAHYTRKETVRREEIQVTCWYVGLAPNTASLPHFFFFFHPFVYGRLQERR